MNLIIEYFNSLNHMRNGEFLYCLHQNLGNDLIENVYLFMEEDAELYCRKRGLHAELRGDKFCTAECLSCPLQCRATFLCR